MRSLSGNYDACLFGEKHESKKNNKNDIIDSFIHADSSNLNKWVGTLFTWRFSTRLQIFVAKNKRGYCSDRTVGASGTVKPYFIFLSTKWWKWKPKYAKDFFRTIGRIWFISYVNTQNNSWLRRGPWKKMTGLLPLRSSCLFKETHAAAWQVELPRKVESQTDDVSWVCLCLSGAPFPWSIKSKFLNPRLVICVHVEGWQVCARAYVCFLTVQQLCLTD